MRIVNNYFTLENEPQIASYKNSHVDIKYSIGNIVNTIVVTMCVVRNDHFVRYMNV